MLGWFFSGSIWPRIKWPSVCSLEICIACRDLKFIVEMANSLLTIVIAVTRTHGRVRSVDSSWECMLCQEALKYAVWYQWKGWEWCERSVYLLLVTGMSLYWHIVTSQMTLLRTSSDDHHGLIWPNPACRQSYESIISIREVCGDLRWQPWHRLVWLHMGYFCEKRVLVWQFCRRQFLKIIVILPTLTGRHVPITQ